MVALSNEYQTIAKMSFKDVKDLSEHLKLIGYPKHIHLSVFCSNYGGPVAFSVVAEILQWLIGRLEPDTATSSISNYLIGDDGKNSLDLSTESERVQFIRAVTEFLITKCGIKINPRKLYSSSFSSAKEILKVTRLLLNAPQNDGGQISVDVDDEGDDSFRNLIELNDNKINELRRARELSSELTNHGAILYDLLKKEGTNKEIRNSHAGRSIELAVIERTLKNSIGNLETTLKQSKEKLEQMRLDKQNVMNKVERKQSELERSRHRLDALKKVRPAYLDEFNKYEEELRELFSQYILRVRCVDALKAQLNSSIQRTPTPTIIPIVQPSDMSMNTLFANDEDLLNDSEEDEDDDDEVYANDDDKVDKLLENDRQFRMSSRVRRAPSNRVGTGTNDGRHVKIRENPSELDSSFNSDESDSVLAELGGAGDSLMIDNTDDVDSMPTMQGREQNGGGQSDEDF